MARDNSAVYAKLKALANDKTAPESERETALLAMDKLRELYGDGIVPADVKQDSVWLRFKETWQIDLIVYIGVFLDLKVYDGRGPRGGRSKEIELHGDVPLLAVAEDLYAFHVKKLERILQLTGGGYMQGAFPGVFEKLTEKYSPDSSRPRLTEEEREALLAGYGAGRKSKADVFPRLRAG